MFNNPYYSQQIDRINNQMADLERMKQQLQQPMQQPTNLTQNFQLAPSNRDVIKYANSMEEVQREMVIGDTPYFSKDMSILWIKNIKGEIKTYELNEIVVKDDKDLMINNLQLQIAELRKEIQNAKSNINDVDEPDEGKEPANISNVRKNAKK